MSWPEDDMWYKWELSNKVLNGPEGMSPTTALVLLIFFIDIYQSAYWTDFCVTLEIVKFISPYVREFLKIVFPDR